MSTERKLTLRKENDQKKQMLAKVKSKFQPFPGGPFVPQRPRGSGDPLGHQAPRYVFY